MRSRFNIVYPVLVLVLTLIDTFVNAATDSICQGCLDDTVHAIPSCKGVNMQKEVPFSSYTHKEQQCWWNVGQNPDILLKCSGGLCPRFDFQEAKSFFKSLYSVYCNGTSLANGGPSVTGGQGSSSDSLPSSVSRAAAVMAMVTSVCYMFAAWN